MIKGKKKSSFDKARLWGHYGEGGACEEAQYSLGRNKAMAVATQRLGEKPIEEGSQRRRKGGPRGLQRGEPEEKRGLHT